MRIAIVDDAAASCEDLKLKLAEYYSERGCTLADADVYESGSQFLRSAKEYDVVFLDIVMPGPDGMKIARLLRGGGYGGELVFTTVLHDFVFDAFGVDAADYLLKPIETDRLAAVMDRIAKRVRSEDASRIVLPKGRETVVICADLVEFFEVLGRRIFAHKSDGTIVEARGRISDIAEQAGSSFFRCHRSYLINFKFVARISGGLIELAGGAQVPLSRLREKEFREAMLGYIRRRQQ